MEYKKGLEYSSFVKNLAETNSERTFFNDGPEDAADVFYNIFEHATDEILMFAENMNETVTSHPKFISGLENFLSKGKNLKIVLADSVTSTDSLAEPLSTILKTYIMASPGQVQIKKSKARVTSKSNPIHFTVSSSMYRKEYDTKKFSAECCFKDDKVANHLKGIFFEIFNNSTATPLPIF